jgi:hypothetical protein
MQINSDSPKKHSLTQDQKIDLLLDMAASHTEAFDVLKSQLNRIEGRVNSISIRTSEDDVATMKDVENLAGRVYKIEKDVKELKAQPAH